MRKAMFGGCSSLFLLVAMCCFVLGAEEKPEDPSTKSCPVFVVLGAGGDLVKRFVWKSLWTSYSSREPFVVVATARGDVSNLLADLNDGLHCPGTDEACSRLRHSWARCTAAWRLKQDADYQLLGPAVADATAACGCGRESQRIYYMAVPPAAYISLSKRIHLFSRPALGSQLMVAFEKPFGRDLSSSLALSEGLKEWLQEEEVFRVDHYLAKMAVQLILKFRCENRAVLAHLFTGQHVQRVDVVAEEALSAQGRTGYYNQYGAVRDMVQNHLTQVLALAAMNLPDNCSSHLQVERSKVAFLKTLPNASSSDALLGQYTTYQGEVVDEGGRERSNTPTFASSILEPFIGPWKGSRFVLTSGKALLTKSTYAHLEFKPIDDASSNCPQEIFFIIYSHHLPVGIIVSEHFKGLKLNGVPAEMLPVSNSTDSLLSPSCRYGSFPCSGCDKEAYDVIVGSLLTGGGGVFVSSDVLTESWRLWDHLVTEADCQPIVPRMYNFTTLHRLKVTPRFTWRCICWKEIGLARSAILPPS